MEKRSLSMGKIFRYAAGGNTTPSMLDGYLNFYYVTHTPGAKRAKLDKGINPLAAVKGPDGVRVPAILISSSPHKIGSLETPWQDFFDPDEGHVRYFGDAKTPGKDPSSAPGNRRMLAAKLLQDGLTRDERRMAPPILMFRRIRVGRRVKGFLSFQGVGLIERTSLIPQYSGKIGRSFPNFAYDIAVFDLSSEFEELDWRWISDRRNPNLTLVDTMRFAPKAWSVWVSGGEPTIARVRRRVTKLLTKSTNEQRPHARSKEMADLKRIYRFYETRRQRFELLAALVVGRILEESGGNFRLGWITPASSDGGADFVGRLDVGSGFSKIKLVVLGQAKCEKPNVTTGGKEVARTVARLQRGWLGAYVTLGVFSEAVQREIIGDRYPILMVPGSRVVSEVAKAAIAGGFDSLDAYLHSIDAQYQGWIVNRRPEEILLE